LKNRAGLLGGRRRLGWRTRGWRRGFDHRAVPAFPRWVARGSPSCRSVQQQKAGKASDQDNECKTSRDFGGCQEW